MIEKVRVYNLISYKEIEMKEEGVQRGGMIVLYFCKSPSLRMHTDICSGMYCPRLRMTFSYGSLQHP